MKEHLTMENLERYLQGQLSPPELLQTDDHLTVCAECRQRAGELDPNRFRIAEIHETLRAEIEEFDHLEYEQIERYVDGELDEVGREIARSHLEVCRHCSGEVEDLREFRREMDAPVVPEPGWWSKFVGMWSLPGRWVPLQVAGAAAAGALLVWVATVSERASVERLNTDLVRLQEENERLRVQAEDSRTEIAAIRDRLEQLALQGSDAPILVSLRDGDRRVTLDGRGNLSGISGMTEQQAQWVRQALRGRSFVTPPKIAGLVGRTGTLLGGEREDASFELLSPVGTVVRDEKPTLRWESLAGASGYRAAVYDANYEQVAAGPLVSGTEWQVPQALKRGAVFTWKVTAIKDGREITSPVAPAPEARFEIMASGDAAELERAVEKAGNSRLMTGILYIQAGLLDEAEREFQSLAAANPDSVTAQGLLRSVQSMRRPK